MWLQESRTESFPQPCVVALLDCDDEDGGVVVPTSVIGQRDQSVGHRFHVVLITEYLKNLRSSNPSRESVGAEQEDIA